MSLTNFTRYFPTTTTTTRHPHSLLELNITYVVDKNNVANFISKRVLWVRIMMDAGIWHRRVKQNRFNVPLRLEYTETCMLTVLCLFAKCPRIEQRSNNSCDSCEFRGQDRCTHAKATGPAVKANRYYNIAFRSHCFATWTVDVGTQHWHSGLIPYLCLSKRFHVVKL